jgi:hypothetical protein
VRYKGCAGTKLPRRDLEEEEGARRGGARGRGPEAGTGATARGSEAVTTGDGSVRGAELKAGRERGGGDGEGWGAALSLLRC